MKSYRSPSQVASCLTTNWYDLVCRITCLQKKYLDTGHCQTIDRGIPQVKDQQKHVANPPSHHHSQKNLETSKPSNSKMDNEQPTWLRFTNFSPLMGPSQIWVLRLLHQQRTTSSSNVSKYLGDSAVLGCPPAQDATSTIIFFVFLVGDPYINLHLPLLLGGWRTQTIPQKKYQKPIHTVDGSVVQDFFDQRFYDQKKHT